MRLISRPLVIAHRGGALEAPENSIESFERAAELLFRQFALKAPYFGVHLVDRGLRPVGRGAESAEHFLHGSAGRLVLRHRRRSGDPFDATHTGRYATF